MEDGSRFELEFEMTDEDFVGFIEHVSLTGEFYLAQMKRAFRPEMHGLYSARER